MLLCNFYPLYDFQSDACPPLISSGTIDNGNTVNVGNDTTIDPAVQDGFRKRRRPALEEYVLAIWVFTLLCEEIRQVSSLMIVDFPSR